MFEKKLLPLRLQFFAENPQEQDSGEDEQQQEDQKEKMLSEEEVNRLVAQAKSKAKAEAIKQAEAEFEEKLKEKQAEAEKLAKMNADEKEKYEREKLEAELAEYKRKDAYYGLSKEASKMLSEHHIQADDDLLAFVVKEDAEATKEAVSSFVKLINRKVEEGVKQALTGNTPRVNTQAGKSVTKESIMAIKDASERIKAIQANDHLFN